MRRKRININGARIREYIAREKITYEEFAGRVGTSTNKLYFGGRFGLMNPDDAEKVRAFLGIRRKTFYPDLKAEPVKEKRGEMTIAEYMKGLQAESPKKASDLIKELGDALNRASEIKKEIADYIAWLEEVGIDIEMYREEKRRANNE